MSRPGRHGQECLVSVTAYLQELFQFDLYKKTQGRHARQVTLIAIVVMVAAGAWSLREWLIGEGYTTNVTTAWPLGVLALGSWAAWRLIQYPVFADFLISVEAEMTKVTWPTKAELFKASLVVIFVIFFLAALLFSFDFVWKLLFDIVLGRAAE